MIYNEPTTHYCSYEGFGINCSTIGKPQITLGNDSYNVGMINPESRIISLVDKDVLIERCPRVRHRINLESLPLNYTSHNVNLTFHFNCTGCPSFATEIPCFKRKSCVQIMNNSVNEVD
ncbi:hypothetical protein Hanom_Chr16g01454051 [Helianthus anomalus]